MKEKAGAYEKEGPLRRGRERLCRFPSMRTRRQTRALPHQHDLARLAVVARLHPHEVHAAGEPLRRESRLLPPALRLASEERAHLPAERVIDGDRHLPLLGQLVADRRGGAHRVGEDPVQRELLRAADLDGRDLLPRPRTLLLRSGAALRDKAGVVRLRGGAPGEPDAPFRKGPLEGSQFDREGLGVSRMPGSFSGEVERVSDPSSVMASMLSGSRRMSVLAIANIDQ